MTVAFGHGLAVTPLQVAVADAALVNGGKLIPPTFLPRTEEEADQLATQVVKPETSDELRYLFSPQRREGLRPPRRRARLQCRRQDRNGGEGRERPLCRRTSG